MKGDNAGRPENREDDPNDLAQAWICIYGLYMRFEDDLSISKIPSPEQMAIKRDLFEKLSKEAKEVISVLIQSPAEFEQFCICLSTGKFKNRKGDSSFFVQRYFRKDWRSRSLTKSVFRELRKFVRNIF